MDPREVKWKGKFQDFFRVFQGEIKKTTVIGRKMLKASKTNGQLHDAYEELGNLFYHALKNNENIAEKAKVQDLVKTIDQCEDDLKQIEKEVRKIKLSSAPVDVSEQDIPEKSASTKNSSSDNDSKEK